jgi:hypothetical protein
VTARASERVRHALALIVALVLLCGCAGHPDGTPEERAARALAAFVHDLSSPDGKLSQLAGTVGGGAFNAPFKLEIGRDGTRHASIDASLLAADLYCAPDGSVVRVSGGNATLERPGSLCPLDAGRFGAATQFLRSTNLSSARADGDLVHATYDLTSGANGTGAAIGNLTLTVDRLDRVTHLDARLQGTTVSADAQYDVRQDLRAPTPTQREAANVGNFTSFRGGNETWHPEVSSQPVRLADLEARVLDATGARVATFHPATPGVQRDGGFAFAYEDQNRDGYLNNSEEMWMARTNWTSEHDYTLQVWDTWAGAPVVRAPGVNAVPFAGVPLLALALALALALRHSRQRG